MANHYFNYKISAMPFAPVLKKRIHIRLHRFNVTVLSFILGIFMYSSVSAQLTGTKNIPGDYATIALAVSDLNAQGVGSGGVIINVVASHTESSGAQITITATGTVANPIVFQKNGVGSNPLVTRTDAGTNTTSILGGLGDAIIRMNGTDYITFDAIDLAASNQGIEYGFFTHKPSGTDGSQFVTIKNCAITMTKGTSAFVNGIYISNGPTIVSSATGVTVSANSGRNENVTIKGNTISNVHSGICCIGFNSLLFYDQNLVIGQLGEGNIIQNYGGGALATSYGVYLIYQNNLNVDYNSINNTGGGGSAHAQDLYGISTSEASGIICAGNNTLTMAMTSANSFFKMRYISNSSTNTSTKLNTNTFSGTFAMPGPIFLIQNTSTTDTLTVSGNQTSGPITNSVAGGDLTGVDIFNNGTCVIANNNFSNISITGTNSNFTGIGITSAGGYYYDISGNTVSDITCGSGARGVNFVNGFGNITGNTISNIDAGGTIGIFLGTSSVGTTNVSGNSITEITGGGAGISNQTPESGSILNIYKNTICGMYAGTSGATGIALQTTTTLLTANVYNNLIGHFTVTNSINQVVGIEIDGSNSLPDVIHLDYNTIYLNATSTGLNFDAFGIYYIPGPSSQLTMRNNVVYNSSIPTGTSRSVAFVENNNFSTQNYSAASDHNFFYGGVPSPTQLIYWGVATSSFSSLTDYQAFMSDLGADQNSVTGSNPFLSTTCGPDFLKYDVSIASLLESRAFNLVEVTDDHSGNLRYGDPGYTGSGSAPDIGAWELEGIPVGSCAGTPDPSNAEVNTVLQCSGVDFMLSLDIPFSVGYSYQWEESITGPSSGFSAIPSTFIASTNASLVTNTTLTKWYRCVVTCVASSQATPSSSVHVIIHAPLAGEYTIDNTGAGDYLSFSDAVTDLNCKTVSGLVIFHVIAGQTFVETSDLEFTATGTSTNTITFRKSGVGSNPKIQRIGTGDVKDYIIKLTGVDYYTINGIDFEQTGNSATNWVEYGVWITNASETNGAKHNTIKNGTVSLTNVSYESRGVYVSPSNTPVAVAGTQSDNSFINMTIQNAFEGYRFEGSGLKDNGNYIDTESGGTSLISNLGDGIAPGSVYGVYAFSQTNFQVNNTEITNLNPGNAHFVYGIEVTSSNTCEIAGNRIHDLTNNWVTYGIHVTDGATAQIHDNEIYDLTTSGNSLRGIFLTGTGLTANVYNNTIYDLTNTTVSTSTVAGIDVATGLEFNIFNNMVSDIKAPSSTASTGGTRGISVSGGSTGGIVRLYHNTIMLNDTGAVVSYTSAALHNSSAVPTLDVRNNIVINKSDITTGLRVVAFWKTATTNNLNANNDNNLFYAGSPNSFHLLYYDGTNSAQTIPAMQAISYMPQREQFSVTEDVLFQSITDGVLRPDADFPSQVERGGTAIDGYTEDFDSEMRDSISPDIGADEGTFVINDATVPMINYVAFGNTSCLISPKTLSGVTIIDATSINTAPGTRPRLYFKKSVGDANDLTGWKFVEASGSGSSPFNFDIDYTLLNAGSVSVGDVIQYFVVAQDLATTPNVGINSGQFAAPPASVLLTPAAFPVTGTINNYMIVAVGLSGTLSVGPAETITSLTNTGGLFSMLNSSGLSGNLVVTITGNITENGTVALNAINSHSCVLGSYTLTIKPAPGLTPVLSGSFAGPLIALNGADHVIFDGSNNGTTSKDMTIRNTSTTGNTIRFINGATSNTIKNVKVEGANTSVSAGTILFSTSTDPVGNRNNTIMNCDIRDRSDAAGIPANALYSNGSNGGRNAFNTISDCNVFNWAGTGVLVTATGAGNGWTINQSSFYQTANRTTSLTAISLQGGRSHSILSNSIGGSASDRSGNPLTTSNAFTGISLNVGTVSFSDVQGNTIANLDIGTGSSSTFKGITVAAGNANIGTVSGNILGGAMTTRDTIRVNGNTDLIETLGTGIVRIENNIVGNVACYQAIEHRLFAIRTTAGSARIKNNVIRDLKSKSTGKGFILFVGGIWISNTEAGANVEGNQIYNLSQLNSGPSPYTIAGIYVSGVHSDGIQTTLVSNNIYNITSSGVGSGLNSPRIWGIHIASVSATYTNNMIAIGTGAGNQSRACGIEDLGSEMNNFYFNTVSVTGTTSSGSNNSYAFKRSGTSTVHILNNIFSNTRTGGLGFHIAIANTHPGATGWPSSASNYNDLYSTTPTRVAQWLGSTGAHNRSLSTWQAVQGGGVPGSGGDLNSLSVAPAFTSATNLHLTPANTSLENFGIPVAGITKDIDGHPRNFITPDMGADEFTTGCSTTVTSINNNGAGSLRDIISCAPNGATITFDADLLMDQTINLSSEIVINKNLILSGLGKLNLTISGGGTSRIFHTPSTYIFEIEHMALKNANSVIDGGGALLVAGNLKLEEVLLENNFENGITPRSIKAISPGLVTFSGNVEIKD